MGVVIFNGRSSKDYGIQVEHPPEYQIPARDYEVIHIPGRNGDLVIDNGSYQNVNRSYQIAAGSRTKDFTTVADSIAAWLHSASGYARLEDSYEPEYFRMAIIKEEVTVENIMRHGGRATVEFNCKPQRYLKSGENIVQSNGLKEFTLHNPTEFDALPKIFVSIPKEQGGRITIGKYPVIIPDSHKATGVYVDCENQEVYTTNLNENITVTLHEGFPKLVPGLNQVTILGNITSVEVTPRWWTL